MMNQLKNPIFFLGLTACFLQFGCGLLPERCPGDIFLDSLSLNESSLHFYPKDLPTSFVFIDEKQNEKIFNIVESSGEHYIFNEQLCSDELNAQYSYYLGNYKKAQFTSERERFFIELGVLKGSSYYEDDLNDIFRIYRDEDRNVEDRLKLVVSDRGNSPHEESEYDFHTQILLNGSSFSNVYESKASDGYVYYYVKGLGVVALMEQGVLWVVKI